LPDEATLASGGDAAAGCAGGGVLAGVSVRSTGKGSAPLVASYYKEIRERRPEADFLQQMSYVELSNRLPELLLMRVDKFSMAHSLEARAPFLDHELVSYALSLPQRSKIQGHTTKKVLKQAVAGILPDEVINRKKQGFRVPLPEWLSGPLAGWAEERSLAVDSSLFSSSNRCGGLAFSDVHRWVPGLQLQ